jgi:hypothetical protein
MRKLILALVLCTALATPAFGALYRVVSFDRGSVTVEFTISEPRIAPGDESAEKRLSRVFLDGFYSLDIEGQPILPVRRFLFEVPADKGISLDVLEDDTYFVEGVLPSVALAKGSLEDERKALAQAPALRGQRFVRLSGVEKIRGRYCAFVDVYPILYDPEGARLFCARRLLLRLSFPRAEETRSAAKGSFIFDGLVVNADQAALWKRAPERSSASARTPFEFARSGNWVKIRVKEKGIYIITYNDLLTAGAYPANIDPGSLRLFSSDPAAEPDSLNQGGSFRDDYHFTEHAILYRGTGTEAFQPGDTVFFYGLGVDGWASDVDPAADQRHYVKHPYATENSYWLTWEGDFTGTPRRMDERSVAPRGSPQPDTVITSYEARIHKEENVLYDPMYTDDRWYWSFLKEGGTPSFSNEFYLSDLADANGVMKTKAYGPYRVGHFQNSAVYEINNVTVGTLNWDVSLAYDPAGMKTLETPVLNVLEGKNTFTVTKPLDDEMYMFWYEIFYRRRLLASQGTVDFYAPRRPGTGGFKLDGFAPGQKLLFDVSFDESPVLCTGWRPESGGLSFEDTLRSYAHHYAAVSRSAFKKFSGTDKNGTLALVNVPSLRDEGACPNMVIIYHERFRTAALMLKAHHEKGLPGIEHPVVRAVGIEDVYNNFSGGRKDPIAIRNYLKFLYDAENCSPGGEPALGYVLLIGNGTYDQRDFLKQGNDFVPLYVNIHYANESEAIEDEDFFVKLDDNADQAPDLAIGRMSVLTEQEANAWAQRIIDYEENPEFGAWRDKVILVADDERSTVRQDDFEFQVSTEDMTTGGGPFPRVIDFKKIYLHIYPFLGDVKPAARKDLIKEWSEGALIMNYSGHGSPLQMADERVMVNSDIYSLTNGIRRPLMLSFSCSVGDLESPYHRSMAQNMVTFDAGGAIGTIAAAAPTYLYPNILLNESIYGELFTSKDSTGTRPVGVALQRAKYSIVAREGYESNNVKYILLGDPAMRIALPAYTIEHETSAIDSMYTGQRCRVEGSVMVGGQVLTSFNGIADVMVQEAEQKVREVIVSGSVHFTLEYTLPGKELFRGTVDVAAGRFTVEYVVPRRCHTGPRARIRSYATSSFVDAVGACDSLRILPTDTLRPDLEPPSVNLYFAGQATKVKAGAKLLADISDPDGIAILGTDPQSSIFLEFDGSGYPVFVTDYFTYDHGSYTTGKVEYPLSAGFASGPHTVLIKAFDNLGQASSDTLRFEIVEGGLFEVSDVFNFPNPFSQNTNFVFQITNPADAKLAIYTVSGLMIWEHRIVAEEGFNSINWDGRDHAGDRIANGTYLYVLEVDFRDSFHRKETVKGKVVCLR